MQQMEKIPNDTPQVGAKCSTTSNHSSTLDNKQYSSPRDLVWKDKQIDDKV